MTDPAYLAKVGKAARDLDNAWCPADLSSPPNERLIAALHTLRAAVRQKPQTPVQPEDAQ